jgi:Zn-finger protein
MSSSTAKNEKAVYKLFGAIVHLDLYNISSFGHYISYVKDCKSNWWKLDDDHVEMVKQNHVLKQNAYILFYLKTSPQPQLVAPSSTFEALKKPLNAEEEKTVITNNQSSAAPAINTDPIKCLNNCGFYGNPQTRNLCSKCFAELYPLEFAEMNRSKAAKAASAKPSINPNISLAPTKPRIPSIPSSTSIRPQTKPPAVASSSANPKIKRNADCPCGSGLKYKKCHGQGQD